jgi:ATP-dependent exoDNAse (exonuclease V) alpha subunit
MVDRAVVEAVLDARPQLAGDQRSLVARLTTSGLGLDAAVGKAGSGKTAALEAAVAVWQASGRRVLGAALAARAADGLEHTTGVPCDTLAGLEARFARGETVLARHDVLLVDEAGMVGTRALARLVRAVDTAHAKLVLVGDHRQLPEIDAGGAFAAVVGGIGAFELRSNRRQEAQWERACLDQLRSGEVAEALRVYGERGRLHLHPDVAEARRALVADWCSARRSGASALMLAVNRADIAALNASARSALREIGALGPDVAVGSQALAVGDDIVCLRNDRLIGVRNGTRDRVVSVDDGCIVTATRRIPRSYIEAGHVAHGYAVTVHKAQGETVDRAFVLFTDTMFREAGYVAMSRGRARSDLYIAEGTFAETRGGGDVDLIAPHLSMSRAKSLASAYDVRGDDATWRTVSRRRGRGR